MINIDIPGREVLKIKNIVFDYNGTIAEDGILIPKVKDRIYQLVDKNLNVYVLTADTNGSVRDECQGLPVSIEIFNRENASKEKKRIVESLGKDLTISIGNGFNDVDMFKSTALSIVVIGKEGCYSKAIFESDIVVLDIVDAIDLILKPNRIKATLRT